MWVLFSLVRWHGKLWMCGRVRRVNLWLLQVIKWRDVAHVGITDTASFVRDDYMTHGLHLKSWGNRILTHLIAEVISEGYVSSVSSRLCLLTVKSQYNVLQFTVVSGCTYSF
jgi:hypothetical protein